MCKGTFNVPVIERTRAQKSVYIRYWRNKEHFRVKTVNGKKVLCYGDKDVLKLSEFDEVVESEFLYCKGVRS